MEKFVKNLKRGGLPYPVLALYADTSFIIGLPESIFAQTDLVKGDWNSDG